MKTERIHIRIKPDEKEKLQVIADRKRRTITSLIEEMIEEILNENKVITKKEVFKALQDNQSAEFDTGEAIYYLHMTSDGEIVSTFREADETFTSKLGIDLEDYAGDSPQKVYDLEAEDNVLFMEVVEELAYLANEWLKDQ